ncbi:MAG: cysteine--tRNA ligase [Polyangiaceae bacterium]|nr:cysteine--tRNA ligase [Polyangiaceae bacterium]
MPETSLKLFDSLTAQLQPFLARPTGEVGVYCCGPTVYDVAHVGHARAALAPDILVRHLRAEGYPVKYVRNITDVDDKILKRAAENQEDPLALSARMTVLYQQDVHALGCAPPDVEPKVSEHIGDIVQLISRLIERGAAYVVEEQGVRSVYYSVRAFPGYGKLSKRKIEELQVGARIEANETKRDPLDFALWKGCAETGWGWPSPWGKGRPGWHIECSAMSERHLGHGFDVHTGGMDLIFPHHENEIAQSEGAFPGEGPFVRTWIHNGFVNVDKEKMAKSLGNFVTIRQVYERNDPEALRYFLLSVHYRGPIAFETEKLPDERVIFPGIIEAERRVDYLYQTLARLRALAESDKTGTISTLPPSLAGYATLANEAVPRLRAALDDDLNTPVALSVIAEVAKAGNELCDLVQRKKDTLLLKLSPYVASRLAKALVDVTERLGLLQTMPATYTQRTQLQRLALRGLTAAAVDQKIADRAAARAAKDFARADAIRVELTAWNVEVFDTPTGTSWRLLA